MVSLERMMGRPDQDDLDGGVTAPELSSPLQLSGVSTYLLLLFHIPPIVTGAELTSVCGVLIQNGSGSSLLLCFKLSILLDINC
jgi:hypothetical protein